MDLLGGRSNVTNLCTITQFLSGALDERRQVDVVDRIDHDILLKKLHSFGFSDNLRLLLQSYLQDRYLYRVITKKRPSLYLSYLTSDFNEQYIKLKGLKSTINWI
jgi:hypothetical protein